MTQPSAFNHLYAPSLFRPLLKALVITLIASAMTFSLFALMQYLVKPTDMPLEETVPYQVIDPVFDKQDSKVEPRKILPAKPKTVTPPNLTPQIEDPGNNDPTTTFTTIPSVPLTGIGANGLPTFTVKDTEAKPMVRVEPKYPIDAAKRGIEGWVLLRFDITPSGTVDNIQVIESEPNRVFDREAKRALSRWKYQPKIIDGEAKPQQNQNVMLSFNLRQ